MDPNSLNPQILEIGADTIATYCSKIALSFLESMMAKVKAKAKTHKAKSQELISASGNLTTCIVFSFPESHRYKCGFVSIIDLAIVSKADLLIVNVSFIQ